MSAIPIPDAAPSIALPDDEEQLRRALAIPAPTPHPLATSNRGIPVDLGGKPIPVDRATGQPEEVNNAGKAIAPGIAGLWTRAENIHNPILRTLGKIGAVGAKAIDVAGSVAAPGLMAQIPGTALHQALGENRAEREQGEEAKNAEETARTAEEQETTREMPAASAAKQRLEGAQADALENKEEKPTIHETDQGIFMVGADGKATPLTYNGQPLMPKGKQDKPDTAEQQFFDSPEEAGKSITQKTEDWARASQRPEQPQRPQQQLGVINGKIVELKPGMDISGSGFETLNGEIKNQAGQQAAQQSLAEAREFAAHPSPTNDFGLLMAFVGVTKPESVGKIRFNQQELRTVVGTRSSLGDVQALEQKLANGEMLTPKQRKDMLSTMEIVARHSGGGGAGEQQPIYASAPGKPRMMSLDGGKTWQTANK